MQALTADTVAAAVRELTDTVSGLRVFDGFGWVTIRGIVTTYYCGIYPSQEWQDPLNVTFAKELLAKTHKPMVMIRDRIVGVARATSDARLSSVYSD